VKVNPEMFSHFVYWAQKIHRRILCTVRSTVYSV